MTTLNTVFFIISIFVAVIDIILTIVLIMVYRTSNNPKQDKPEKKEYFVTGMSVQNRENEINTEIDYHGADRLGGTDNGEDVETVYKTVYKMSDYGCEEIKDKEQENI